MKHKFGFIVEGTWDEFILRKAYPGDYPIIILKGCGVSKHILNTISNVKDTCEQLFIATDPDEAGDLAAQKIKKVFDLPRLQFDPEKCKCYRGNKIKVGIQHCSVSYIKEIVGKSLKN